MYKYKRQLESEGKIFAKPVHSKPPHNLYYVPDQHHPVLDALKKYKTLHQLVFGDLEEFDWIPTGRYPLTKNRMNPLWVDERTQTSVHLVKTPAGFIVPPHIHPYENEFTIGLAGEGETPQGEKVPMKDKFHLHPKGVVDLGGKVTKESICLVFSDGHARPIEV